MLPSPGPSRGKAIVSLPTLRNRAKAGLLVDEHETDINILPLDTTSKECMPIDKAKARYDVNAWGTLSLVLALYPPLLESTAPS